MSNTVNQAFMRSYFADYARLAFDEAVWPKIHEFADLATSLREAGNKMMFFGNGASASLAAHAALDFTKQGKVRSQTCHDAAIMTAFANDFTYDRWMAEAIKHYGDAGDVVVLISVSGTSPSVVEAAKEAKNLGMKVVSFTGRDPKNPTAKLADIDFFVDSHAYNLVECIHGIWVTTTIDYVIGASVYETRMY